MAFNKHFMSVKFIITISLMLFFVCVIAYADKFWNWEQNLVINNAFVWLNNEASTEISIDEITSIQIDSDEKWVIKYIVQAGDSLEKISTMFGTTVSHIKKVNDISWPIRPKQTLIITDEDVWFVYPIEEKTNIVVFANKYNLNLQDLMSLNYIQDETEILFPGQEIFINIKDEQAYDKWLLERPAPIIVSKPKNTPRPVISKPQSVNNRSSSSVVRDVWSKKWTIISQWTYTKKISNKFYPWYCTWYAAIISPEIFPYVDENTQSRAFGWNAKLRCANAKAAWFLVWSKPAVWALIVYKSSRTSSAWHVGKVINYYPSDGKMIIRDMNYVAKFVVTERREYTSNSSISCYIYPGK